MSYLFTSESVSEGHPDKIADQISDAILDNFLAFDPDAKVACETLVTTGQVILSGEVKSKTYVDVQKVVRQVIKKIGYTKSEYKFDYKSCGILSMIHEQSEDINRGVVKNINENQGAGDQGIMFGYACNETEVLMPAPIHYSHKILRLMAQDRKLGKLKNIEPDSKSQVTFEYVNGKPSKVKSVVISSQHSKDVNQDQVKELLRPYMISSIPKNFLEGFDEKEFYVNPTGNFVIGGPDGDCGLTGRKIIVDTYGGAAPHGGGAFSGKDPTKVDRSAAYAARYVAKNIVAAGLADKCEIQISYAIGVSKPTSISVDTFGTSIIDETKIVHIINEVFDLRPWGITNMLGLLKPIYKDTASYGHFGRSDLDLSWEKTDKIDVIKSMI